MKFNSSFAKPINAFGTNVSAEMWVWKNIELLKLISKTYFEIIPLAQMVGKRPLLDKLYAPTRNLKHFLSKHPKSH